MRLSLVPLCLPCPCIMHDSTPTCYRIRAVQIGSPLSGLHATMECVLDNRGQIYYSRW